MTFGSTLKAASVSNVQEERKLAPYLRLNPGEYTIRIVGQEQTFWRYWIPVRVGDRYEGRSVIAAYDNPIKTSDRLNDQAKRPSRRFVVNVYDRTEVIRTPDGAVVYPDEFGSFSLNGNPVSGRKTPRNEVLILEFGMDMMNEFLVQDGRMRSRKDHSKVLRVTETDLILVVRGQGRERTVKVMQGFNEDPVDVNEIYDLSEIVRPYPNEAIQELLDGQEYTDVLKKYNLIREYRKIPY